jgi:hypothetical protein
VNGEHVMKLLAETLQTKIAALLLLLTLLLATNANALEKPEYTVLLELGKIEYRQYKSYIVAETVVADEDYNRAVETGFNRLFDYISGNNSGSEKVSMTAPVEMARTGIELQATSPVSTRQTAEGIRMAFMLPSEYDMLSAPKPLDDTVALNEIPERVMAAIRFSGRWTERNLTENEARLLENIAEQQLDTVGPSVFAAYNPPFIPPWFRRNEILFEVNGLPKALTPKSSGD